MIPEQELNVNDPGRLVFMFLWMFVVDARVELWLCKGEEQGTNCWLEDVEVSLLELQSLGILLYKMSDKASFCSVDVLL